MTGGLLRDQFPILEATAYLATHSLGAVPRIAADALAQYHRAWAELGIQAWDGPWWNAMGEFSRRIERLLSAPAGTVVPMENATRAIAGALSCFDFTKGRRTIVLTDLEFETVYPLVRRLQARGARVKLVRSDDQISVPAERVAAAIDDDTRVVLTSHVFFRSAAIQDLAPVIEAARDHDALAIVDGYHALGTIPVDVQALGADFYLGGSHKWLCGGPGAAYLYVRHDRAGELVPALTGWFGLEDPFAFEDAEGDFAPHAGVQRFLGGTPSVPGLYAAREGIKLVEAVGPAKIRAVTSALSQRIVEGAQKRGWKLRCPVDAEARSAMVCFDFPGSREAAAELVRQGIVVDWRPGAGIRASTHFYNTEEDVDRLFKALPP